jgi:DNA-binding NtrC family response regulator
VVLRRVDRLSEHMQRAFAGLLSTLSNEVRGTAESAPWLVATSASGDLDGLLELFPVTVTVPPLRHHADDIADLTSTLIERHAPRPAPTMSAGALQTLRRAPWPSNVAQLELVIRKVLSEKRIGQIEQEDLPPECHASSRRLLTHWETVERDAIAEALLNADGDRLKAAELLGISRATIYRKIHDFGIVVEPNTKVARNLHRVR